MGVFSFLLKGDLRQVLGILGILIALAAPIIGIIALVIQIIRKKVEVTKVFIYIAACIIAFPVLIISLSTMPDDPPYVHKQEGGFLPGIQPVPQEYKQVPTQKTTLPRLFANASNGIQQWVVGEGPMRPGVYHFDCGSVGNVSVQLGASPYTVSMESGDQIRRLRVGDLVTVGWCVVYGPD